MDATTTRGANGALTTTTSGGPSAPGGAGLSPLFDALIKQRIAKAQQDELLQMAMPQAALQAKEQARQPIERAPVREEREEAPRPQPQLEASKPAPVAPATRMRRVRNRTSIPSMLDQNGITYDDVKETQLPDGSWSGDALYGTLAGNEAAARQHMDALDHPFAGSGAHGGDDRDDRQRPGANTAIPWSQTNRNQDARGEGYGMDYGKVSKKQAPR